MLDALLAALPAYAHDVKRTLTVCLEDETLSSSQKWGALIAAAQTFAAPDLTRAIEAEAPLTTEMRDAARGVAAVMAMNNVYFRATHLMSNPDYAKMRAGIRMAALTPGAADAIDIELWAITVSALNGCGACIDDHEANLRKAGADPKLTHAVLRLSAALAGAAAVLRAQAAR